MLVLLQMLRKRSAELLAKELGAPGPNDLSSVLCSRRKIDEMRRLLNPNKELQHAVFHHKVEQETEREKEGRPRPGEATIS